MAKRTIGEFFELVAVTLEGYDGDFVITPRSESKTWRVDVVAEGNRKAIRGITISKQWLGGGLHIMIENGAKPPTDPAKHVDKPIKKTPFIRRNGAAVTVSINVPIGTLIHYCAI